MARRNRPHLGRGHLFQDNLAAGGSSPGVFEAGDGAPGGRRGDPRASRHDLRPHRPAVGDERANGVRFHRSAAGARPGSRFRTAGAGAAHGPCDSLRQDEVGARQPPRVSLGQAQDRLPGFTSKTKASATTRRERWRRMFWGRWISKKEATPESSRCWMRNCAASRGRRGCSRT